MLTGYRPMLTDPHPRYTWRLPIKLALAGLLVAVAFDLACPRVVEPLIVGPFAQEKRVVDALEEKAPPARINTRPVVVRNMAPGIVEVYVSIAPHVDNRGYIVALRCEQDRENYIESERSLDGDKFAGPFPPLRFRELPKCRYVVTATLFGRGRVTLASSQPRFAHIVFCALGDGSCEQ